VTILSEAGEITYEASSAKRILGHDTKDMVGRPLADFVPAEQRPELREFIALLLATPGASTTVELPARHADGTARAFEMTGRNLLHDPSIGGLVVNMRDISERRRLIAELERLSETDQLTGTLNRRGFLKLAEREFQRARRSGLPLTFVMVDIDHFKGVNDTYGHAAGDMVLAKVAEQCREHLRTIDVVARFGGEEFIILLTDMPLEAAHGVMERLLAAIAVCRVTTIKGDVSVTASFGLSVIDANKIDLETGIRLADEALYEAKNAGRNCIKVRQAS
jgi:diguanylate cyclase (GGDEF)-like protein/PAS domain S-box-containing protein